VRGVREEGERGASKHQEKRGEKKSRQTDEKDDGDAVTVRLLAKDLLPGVLSESTLVDKSLLDLLNLEKNEFVGRVAVSVVLDEDINGFGFTTLRHEPSGEEKRRRVSLMR
jgi:hypothetical protein